MLGRSALGYLVRPDVWVVSSLMPCAMPRVWYWPGPLTCPAPGTHVHGVTVVADVDALLAGPDGLDVVVDFTVAEASRVTLPVLAAAGVHAVVGTSGLGDDDLAALSGAFTTSNCVVAPNFAIGAVLMMRFAEMAAPWFDTAEIVEIHHDGKVDAPSGTAVATAERMAAASAEWAPDPTTREVMPGGPWRGRAGGHPHPQSPHARRRCRSGGRTGHHRADPDHPA